MPRSSDTVAALAAGLDRVDVERDPPLPAEGVYAVACV